MKFKSGDKVIVINWDDYLAQGDSYHYNLFKNTVGEIDYIFEDPARKCRVWFNDYSCNTFEEECLELESIYNSPLYQALL